RTSGPGRGSEARRACAHEGWLVGPTRKGYLDWAFLAIPPPARTCHTVGAGRSPGEVGGARRARGGSPVFSCSGGGPAARPLSGHLVAGPAPLAGVAARDVEPPVLDLGDQAGG